MDSKQRKKTWEELSDPKPAWETWKRILSQKGNDASKAKEQWDRIKRKKLDKQA